MSAPTRYLLDKVVVRYTLDGMLSLSLGRELTEQQLTNLWSQERSEIERRFGAMRRQLISPYHHGQLPEVQLLQ